MDKISNLLVNSARLAKPLSKKEKWKLSKISKYLTKEQQKKVKKLVKQKKAKIEFSKKGYSFMLVNKDVIPKLDSNLKEAEDINKVIERIYYREAFKHFSERAWQAIPQYIAPSTIGLRGGKSLATLMLFTKKPLQILLCGNPGIGKNEILKSVEKLSSKEIPGIEEIKKTNKEHFIASLSLKNKISTYSIPGIKKNLPLSSAQLSKFHLILMLKEPDLDKFADLADKIITEERVKISASDISFIKKYISEAKNIKTKIPLRISNDIRDFSVILKEKEDALPWAITGKTVEAILELVKASARMEMRNRISVKDLDRVFGVINSNYKGFSG